jgi:hypothetical protein
MKVVLGLIVSSILMVSGVRAENAGFSKYEIAIWKAIESCVETYSRGDASTPASHWSQNGPDLTQTGQYAKGPDTIRPAFENSFAEPKGIQVKVSLFDVQPQSAPKRLRI